jgi:hypothetical protein
MFEIASASSEMGLGWAKAEVSNQYVLPARRFRPRLDFNSSTKTTSPKNLFSTMYLTIFEREGEGGAVLPIFLETSLSQTKAPSPPLLHCFPFLS